MPVDTSAAGLTGALADIQRRSYFLSPVAEKSTTHLAANAAQHLTAHLGAATYTLAAASFLPHPSPSNQLHQEDQATPPAWNVRFILRGLGRRGQVSIHPQATASATATDTTIHYAHGAAFAVDYVNSPAGVRQNYQVAQRPGSTGPLQVLLRLETQLHVQKEDSTTLTFATNTDSTVLRYSGLQAWDATGRVLPAHLAWQNNTQALTLEVDDAHATYPITIDPLASTPSATLTDPAPNYSGQFGYSVAGAGDVNGDGYADAIVGVPGSNSQGRAYLFLGSSNGLSKTPVATLQDPAAALYSLFGFSVAGAGDVNGDGYADVLVGAWGTNADQGSAYLYLGSSTGLSAIPSTTFNPAIPNSLFGRSVAGIGDVNGDGYGDILIGADGNTGQGRAYLYLGSSTGVSATSQSILTNTGSFGRSVAAAGDVNGDGYADAVIGAPDYDGRGAAFLYLGSSTGLSAALSSTLSSPATSGDQFGFSAAGAGDVNGDGYADVVVGTYRPDDLRGRAYVYLGSSTGLSATPSTLMTNPATEDKNFGQCVASAGDVNGDGYADVLIGAPGTNDLQGRTYVYLGSAAGVSTVPSTTLNDPTAAHYDQFGFSAAGAGDVNGDGYADVLIGAWGSNNSNGSAHLYLGSTATVLTSASESLTASEAASFGYTVAGAGDVNGDGYADMLIGAFRTAGSQGRAYLYLGGRTGLGTTAAITLPDPTSTNNDQFGYGLAGMGDINGDGYADIVVSAPGASSGEGRAYLYLGTSTGVSTQPTLALRDPLAVISDNFAKCVASAGDVNGDGYADVLISADGNSTGQGRAYLYLGSSTGLPTTPSISLFDPTATTNDVFGSSLASAGDVNGDGYADVIIGAPGASNLQGRAYLYLGGSTGLATTPSVSFPDPTTSYDSFGCSVAGAGDVNGDGYADIVIGASKAIGGNGRAYLYLGRRIGPSATPSSTLNNPGGSAPGFFGQSVAGAGDINGDGYSDIFVGAYLPVGGAGGRAYLFLGSGAGLSSTPNTFVTGQTGGSTDFFGFSVTGTGDVNGDGYADVLVGAWSTNVGTRAQQGKAYLYLGNEGGSRLGRLRFYNTDLITPLAQTNVKEPQVGLGLVARSAFGRVEARLVWEAVGNGIPFSTGASTTNSTAYSGRGAWTDLLASNPTELKSLIPKAGRTTRVRARLEYSSASSLASTMLLAGTGGTGALPRYGPWIYVDAQQLGQSTNSATPLPVSLSQSTGLQLQAYPNPFQNQLTVRLDVEQPGPAILQLTDVLGRVIVYRTLTLMRGATTFTLPEVSFLHSGLYLLTLRQNTRLQSITLVHP
ncbi:FG-GAP-like repeat-containing protein [Hymenobacter sp. GOD-10R]|uniref:FG-GAP-like repeat-containing protein n=1 Tax=Hymenobacter sp. GOD-10R TaxID=3093922 RepID=UPI002D77E1D2|nr:FG-GAP-like repeat-containing protein [Hymenobacter sp. GOD-10R]WRQ28719.1 FG-GAP-like repeat-containing protein [Hymenobacter sp. GOD-10R]